MTQGRFLTLYLIGVFAGLVVMVYLISIGSFNWRAVWPFIVFFYLYHAIIMGLRLKRLGHSGSELLSNLFLPTGAIRSYPSLFTRDLQ